MQIFKLDGGSELLEFEELYRGKCSAGIFSMLKGKEELIFKIEGVKDLHAVEINQVVETIIKIESQGGSE